MPRRERWSVIGDILAALAHERAKGDGARISNVAARANIAYDRLQPYLDEIAAAGLILLSTNGGVPELTPKGREFLRHYKAWTGVLEDFGLD
ncbi:MAG TPA: winged helix-turn-helix domain-containing protein [Candidatus Thermoplasmatota archaeon]|nr:winged helix-turn-helix domain-containing protein [Candidatus Thermoplasmatota archaeon]